MAKFRLYAKTKLDFQTSWTLTQVPYFHTACSLISDT